MLKGVNSTTFDAMVIGLRKITEKLSLTLANFDGVYRALVTRNIGSFSTIS
jgi:hypothetical protein